MTLETLSMKKILLSLTLVFTLIAPLSAQAAVKAGASCKKAGLTSTVAGKKFTCVKSGKKLVWNKGVAVVTTNPVKPVKPVAPVAPATTDDKRIDLTARIANLPGPVFLGLASKGPEDLTIKLRVDSQADGAYVEIPAFGLGVNETFTKKGPNNEVTISVAVPSSFKVKTSIEVRLFSLSATRKSPCCNSIGTEVFNLNRNIINPYVSFSIEGKAPTAELSPNVKFSNLTPCRIPDGDPSLTNMSTGFPMPVGRTDATKPITVAVLAATFADIPATGDPNSDYANSMFVMKQFWEAQIDNGTQISFRTTPSYKIMPKNLKEYDLSSGYKSQKYQDFVQAVMNAYDPIFDFTGVSTVVVVLPTFLTTQQVSGWMVHTQNTYPTNETLIHNIMLTGSGPSMAATDAWVHEYGHTFGISDFRYIDKNDSSIQKPQGLGIYDVMGSGFVAAEILIWNRFIARMINDDQIHCINDSTSSTHFLRPIETEGKELKGIVIPTGTYTALVVESRRSGGFDKLDSDQEGALVYTIDTTIPYLQSAAQIVSPSRSKDLEWYTDSALKLGESVQVSGWKISVVESGDFGDVVKVEKVG